jgi:probable HAF family extracellular repeat protein
MVNKLFFGLMMLILVLMAAPAAGLGAGPRYLFKDIGGEGRAIDINDSGQIITNHNGFYTPDGGWTVISLTGIGTSGQPFTINNAGQVAGYGYDRAYLWTAAQGMTLLPGIEDRNSIIAYNINNLGQIVGYIGGPISPVRWDGANSVTDLTTLPGWNSSSVEGLDSDIMPINDSGLIACRVWVTDQGWAGALFNGTGWTFLGSLTPGGKESRPTSLNNKGEVVGSSPSQPGGGMLHAFHWHNGVIKDLGTLRGFIQSDALHINEAGQIVGTCCNDPGTWWGYTAVIWTPEGIQDLNKLVVNLPPNTVLRRGLCHQ